MERTVPCPRCGQPSLYAPSNPHRPFCSDRCKLIDLGQWANEAYKVPAKDRPEDENDEVWNEESQESE